MKKCDFAAHVAPKLKFGPGTWAEWFERLNQRDRRRARRTLKKLCAYRGMPVGITRDGSPVF